MRHVIKAVERSPAVAGFIIAAAIIFVTSVVFIRLNDQASDERIKTLEILANDKR